MRDREQPGPSENQARVRAMLVTAVTKSGTGTGTWDVGTHGRGDFGTRRRAAIRGREKQITSDFCAELVKYFF